MNPIETFLLCVVSVLATWFAASGVYDLRERKQQKRIDELEKENAELHFDAHRESAAREQFEKECG